MWSSWICPARPCCTDRATSQPPESTSSVAYPGLGGEPRESPPAPTGGTTTAGQPPTEQRVYAPLQLANERCQRGNDSKIAEGRSTDRPIGHAVSPACTPHLPSEPPPQTPTAGKTFADDYDRGPLDSDLQREECARTPPPDDSDAAQWPRVATDRVGGHPPSEPEDVWSIVLHHIHSLNAEVAALNAGIGTRKNVDAAIADLAAQNKALTEKLVLHDFVYPLVRCLATVADRFRAHARRIAALGCDGFDISCGAHREHLLEFADLVRLNLVEVDNAFAALGVELFQHASDAFDPTSQECVGQVFSTDPGRHGKVAARVSPGCRRGAHLVQRERVRLWIFNSDSGLS